MKNVVLKTIGKAVANNCGAMEADTISKNGRKSKSQMSRGNVLLFFILLFLFSSFCYGQKEEKDKKRYVLSPTETTYLPSDTLDGININIEIKDARKIPNKRDVIKISFDDISYAIQKAIKQTYGNSFVSKGSDVKVILLVEIYEARYYASIWCGETRYKVIIKDKEEIIEQRCYDSHFNHGGNPGYKVGQIVLNKSLECANLKFFHFLNETLIEND